jgi:pyridoxal 5'-phosphate synthase pdxT subunit
VNKLVGVLAIQGDFQAHLDVLKMINVESREVRNLRDLAGVTHLIIPGGESTTIRKIAQFDGLWDKIGQFEGPVMGTCMGSILMAKKILDPDGTGWGMLDLTIRRNAYGRQVHSFTSTGRLAFDDEPFEMVFIRAPRFAELGKDVMPIAWLGDEVTGVVSGNKMALTFHPELTGNTILHRHFLEI